MTPLPAAVRAKPEVNSQKILVGDLIRRVDLLMRDGRYPPLHNQKVKLNIPFHIRYPRT